MFLKRPLRCLQCKNEEINDTQATVCGRVFKLGPSWTPTRLLNQQQSELTAFGTRTSKYLFADTFSSYQEKFHSLSVLICQQTVVNVVKSVGRLCWCYVSQVRVKTLSKISHLREQFEKTRLTNKGVLMADLVVVRWGTESAETLLWKLLQPPNPAAVYFFFFFFYSWRKNE